MATRTVSVTAINTNIDTYFNTTTSTTGSISIVPQYSVSAGYVANKQEQNGTVLYYNIKTTSLTADSANVDLVSDTTGASGNNPFSIYSSSNTRNILVTTTTTTAAMGTNRVYIKVNGTGSVAASTTGWLTTTAATSSTTTRYISMDLYTGEYETSEGT